MHFLQKFSEIWILFEYILEEGKHSSDEQTLQAINREAWDGMMDLQQRHSSARGVPWLAMLEARRVRRDLLLSDEVDTCSQWHHSFDH